MVVMISEVDVGVMMVSRKLREEKEKGGLRNKPCFHLVISKFRD